MGFTPKSVAPLPVKRGRRSFYALTPEQRAGKGERARKIKKPKPGPDLLAMSDDQLAELSQTHAYRRAKKAHSEKFHTNAPPTDDDVADLAALLGTTSRSVTITFVEFANQLPRGIGTIEPWGKPRATNVAGKAVFLSRIYWRRAHMMARNGYNDLCTANDELAVSMGYADETEMAFGDLFSLVPKI